jgi:hypothetical protein
VLTDGPFVGRRVVTEDYISFPLLFDQFKAVLQPGEDEVDECHVVLQGDVLEDQTLMVLDEEDSWSEKTCDELLGLNLRQVI